MTDRDGPSDWEAGSRAARQRTARMVHDARQRQLARLPDLPRWVETRDLLAWEGSRVIVSAAGSGFVVWSAEDGLGSIAGKPDADALANRNTSGRLATLDLRQLKGETAPATLSIRRCGVANLSLVREGEHGRTGAIRLWPDAAVREQPAVGRRNTDVTIAEPRMM